VSTAATQRVTTAFRSGPLALRNFWLLAGGQFASTIGDYCYAVALPWLVLSNHGSTVLLGLVLACYGVPRTVLMPFGGVLADKIGPRTLMLFADVMRCALVGVLTFFAARHDASIVSLGPIAALIGAGEAMFIPASYTIMPSLLDEARLAAGNAMNSAAVQVGQLIGPGLGGALVATTGSSTGAMGVDAASFAVSALTLSLLPRRAAAGSMAAKSAQAAASQASTADDQASTATAEPAAKPLGMVAYIRGSRALQIILLVGIVMNMANGGMVEVALPALAHARWGAGAYGALLACVAIGAVLGTLGAGRTGRMRAPGHIASVGFIIEGVAMSLLPFLGGRVGAGISLLFVGAAGGLGGVIFFTTVQRHIPSAILGRVMGVIMMCAMGAFPLSVLVTGILVRHLGTTPFFPIAGIILAVSVAAGNTSREFRSFAELPELS
jgi:MFS family permease